ncbi:MAG: trypsin-like peptidase domain-containing protein [Eubacteriales bacterium]|nr:trypsin-like peptidase domain-containing protein [Eubacteriales bacterium]
MDYNAYNNNAGQGYDPNVGQPKEKKGPKGARVFVLILVGAIIGSVLGGGAVSLYLEYGSNGTALTASAEDYIDEAISAELESYTASLELDTSTAESDDSVQETTYNEVNLVTTDYSTAVQSIAETVMPSVVSVRTIETIEMYRQSFEVEGIGTGVIVSSDGLILTNQHVVSSNPTSITVTLIDGSEYDAEVLFADESMDLAIIKIDASGLTAANLGDSDDVSVGEVAIAIGNPLGLEYTRSMTAGIISALDRSILISDTQIAENLIQTDAAINSGNSGGPLLNLDGQVVGINTYKLTSSEGMGFAIPINAAIPIIEQIIETGEFQQAQLGVSVIDKELLNYYSYEDLTLEYGVYVYSIDESSDAYEKGLDVGDIITKVDGIEVNTILKLKEQLYSHLPGDTVTITVERDGSTFELNVELSGS